MSTHKIARWLFFEILQYIRFIVFGFPAVVASFMLLLGTFVGIMVYFQEINPQGLDSIGQFFIFFESVFNISIPEHFTDEDLFKLYLPATTVIFLLIEVIRPFMGKKFEIGLKQKVWLQLIAGFLLVIINVALFIAAFPNEEKIRLGVFLGFFFSVLVFLSVFYSVASVYSNKGINLLKEHWS